MLKSPYPLRDPKSGTLNPLVATTVFGVIALITTVIRMASRRIKRVSYGWDDWMIISAMTWTYIMLGIQWACVIRGGVGHHTTNINPLDVVLTLKLILPFEAIYALANASIKLSILLLYFRIFGSDPVFKKRVFIVGIVVILWAIHIVMETFLICRPLSYNWDTSIDGSCGDRNAMFVVAGATNMVTDLMVMLLPIPTIWKLNMKFLRKLGIMAIFCLGTFISVISIIRLKSLLDISFTDPSYTLPMGLMWSVLEAELGILNANLPVVRPFFSFLFPKFFSTLSARSRGRSYGTSTDPKRFERLDDGTYPLNQVRQPTPMGGFFDPSKPEYAVGVSGAPPSSEGGESHRHQRDASREVGQYGMRNMDNFAEISSQEEDSPGTGEDFLASRRSGSRDIRVQKEWNVHVTESRV